VDTSNVNVLCEALLQRLLPEIRALVEEVATAVASRTVQSLCQAEAVAPAQQGATLLGALQTGRVVNVGWTFTNSGGTPWPGGARLRFLRGSLCPPPSFVSTAAQAPTPAGGRLTVEAAMVAPQEPGPCEAHWQLEAADGSPLSPPLTVQGVVLASATGSQLESSPRAASRSTSKQAVVQHSGEIPRALEGAAQPEPLLPRGGVRITAAAAAAAPGGTQPQGTSVVPRVQPVPLAAHVRSSAYPAQAQAVPTASQTDAWVQAFEDFFGRDVLTRLRQIGGTEQQRMLSQVWEHLKKKGLCRSAAEGLGTDSILIDDVLMRLYGPALPPGTSRVRTSDVLPLTQQIITKYKECKGAA